MRLRLGWLALALALAGMVACSSPEKRRKEFAERDGDERLAFMAYFPLLVEEERMAILEGGWITPEMIRDMRTRDTGEVYGPPLPVIKDLRQAARLLDLRIVATPTEKGYDLEALGRWEGTADAIDITAWVDWRTFSEFARIEPRAERRSELIVSCGSGPLIVEVNFMGEARAETTLEIRKSVTQLLVELDAKGDNLEQSRHQKARAVAFCSDGTQSDISCGASWSLVSGSANIGLCGRMEVRGATTDGADVRVQAKYGGRKTTADVYFSRRKSTSL